MALIDFHCHLDLYSDPQRVVQEVIARGVYVLSVTTTPSAFVGTKKLAPPGGRIRTALGLHPEIAVQREGELALFENLLSHTDYVGEVGLDGSRPHRATLDRQGAILTTILGLCAKNGGKTISLHSRGASKLLLDVIEAEPRAGRTVLHWFTGTEKETARAAELGCWFSVGAPMLRSETGRKALLKMPLDRLLPETDGPFTATDGRPTYPWEAMDFVDELASLVGRSTGEVTQDLTNNFKRLVELSSKPIC